MTELYIAVGLTAAAAGIVILDFIGPSDSKKPFWTALRKIRAVLDSGSYFIICAIAVFCIAVMVICSILSIIR